MLSHGLIIQLISLDPAESTMYRCFDPPKNIKPPDKTHQLKLLQYLNKNTMNTSRTNKIWIIHMHTSIALLGIDIGNSRNTYISTTNSFLNMVLSIFSIPEQF